jgi:hypothetical protein
MFNTIYSVMRQMCMNEKRQEYINEILSPEVYGLSFPESLLPYLKQLIYRAIEAHDIRAPEDKW